VAALSEFVRLKIYPMCTVYQVVAISIGARGRAPSLSSSTRPLFLSLSLSLSLPASLYLLSYFFARLFLKGVPFYLSPLDAHFFPPTSGPPALPRFQYNSRLVNNSDDRTDRGGIKGWRGGTGEGKGCFIHGVVISYFAS